MAIRSFAAAPAGLASRARRLLLCVLALGAAPLQAADPLAELIGEALGAHPAVLAARARAGSADADLEGARWQYYPTPYVNADSRAGGGSSYYRGDPMSTTLGVRQPLWTGGRLAAGLERAEAGRDQADADAGRTREQLALRLAQTYGDWFAAWTKRQAYDKGRQVHERLLAQVRRRVEEGMAARSDHLFAEGRLASLQAEWSGVEAQEQIGRARLSQLVGRPLATGELARAPAASRALTASLAELLDEARARSPQLSHYRAEARLQQAALDERKAELWPEVALRIERQHGNLTVPGAAADTAVFVSLQSRLGAGLSNAAAIAAARGRQAAAVADIDAQQRELDEQILADHALMRQAEARRHALRAALELSGAVLDSWDRQYLAGRKSWQDLMNSAREQIQTEVQLADVDSAQLVASWRLALLTRGVDAIVPARLTDTP